MHDFLASNAGLIRKERGVAHKHFKQNNPNRPPVHTLVIPVLAKDFWGYVVWGPHRAVSQVPVPLVVEFLLEHLLQLVEVL